MDAHNLTLKVNKMNDLQQTQEWFASRIGKVTASNVSAILGISPFRNRAAVMRKMVRDQLGFLSEEVSNAATEYGTFHEHLARADFEMFSGKVVQSVGFIVSHKHDWLGASPDGLIGDDAIIEIKCPFAIRNEIFPQFKSILEMEHYYAQIQIQLLVTERESCEFYQWTQHGSKLETVYFNQSYIDNNLPKLHEFYLEFLSECQKPEKYLLVHSNESKLIEKCEKYKRTKDAIKVFEADCKLLLEEISSEFEGDAMIGKYELKLQSRKTIAYSKALKELLPNADLSAYESTSEFWVLK